MLGVMAMCLLFGFRDSDVPSLLIRVEASPIMVGVILLYVGRNGYVASDVSMVRDTCSCAKKEVTWSIRGLVSEYTGRTPVSEVYSYFSNFKNS